MRVLIVDDSRLARMAVIKNLAKLRPDWTYAEAANPDEALDPKLPIALLSANAQEEILERTAQLGATFLSKPLNEASFGAFLEAAARK